MSELTRRRLLALAGGAMGAQLLHPFDVLAAPRASSRVLSLPAARRIGPLAVPGGFELAGLRWPGAIEAHAHLRARRSGGRWTEWLPLGHGHAPDSGRGASGTDPLWTGQADEFELRLDRPVRGLRLHTVRTHAARRVARPAARAAQAGGPPPIILRAQWGGDRVKPRATPSYGEVRMAFVHHTVTANEYGPEDSAAIVLAIAYYHRDSNGWNDVGYNFLVDKYGQIFEGRAGGIEAAVIGAQAQGFNGVSTGIANLGTFESVAQMPAALDALGRLIAWKLGIHGAPVQGEVTVIGRGGDSSRFAAGQPVTFQRISGHRDGDKTSCPGSALYAQLPDIRRRAANAPAGQPVEEPSARGRVTLAAGATVIGAGALPVTGTVQGPDGSPRAGAPVSLQIRGTKRWNTVVRTSSGADGRFAADVPIRRNARVRAFVKAGDGMGVKPAVSDLVPVTVVPTIVASAAARRVRFGGRVTFTVEVSPQRPRVLLAVDREVSPGRYARVATVRARVAGGRAVARIRLARPALYRITAVAPADARAASASAPEVFVRAIRGTPAKETPPATAAPPATGGAAPPA